MKTHSIFFIFLLCSLVGCGGGSSGTGVPDSFVGKVLTGSVLDENSAPLSGAEITVAESGESVTTGSSGNFVLSSSVQGDINVTVNVAGISTTLLVAAESSSRTELKITVNRRTGLINVSNLSITAKITGSCDFAFENNAIIRQSNKLTTGSNCPVRVSVKRSGQGLSGIPFKLEHKKCDDKAPWKKVVEGLTSQTGVGEENFKFSTAADSCDYRVVVAFDVKGVTETIFPVSTFQRQDKDAATTAK